MPGGQLPAPIPLRRSGNRTESRFEKADESFRSERQGPVSGSNAPLALGISSIALGLASLLFLPFCAGVFTAVLNAPGIVFGGIGLIISLPEKKRVVGVPIAGLGINILVLILFFVLLSVRFSSPLANNAANGPVKQVAESQESLQQKQLADGDELLRQGKKEQAVAKYKTGFSAAGNRKAELIKTIVDFEVEKNHVGEGRQWIERGLDLNLQIDYANEDSRKFLAKIKKERERRGAAVDQDELFPNRFNFAKITKGMNRQQVEAILGKPVEVEVAPNGRIVSLAWDLNKVPDKDSIMVGFLDGVIAYKVLFDDSKSPPIKYQDLPRKE